MLKRRTGNGMCVADVTLLQVVRTVRNTVVIIWVLFTREFREVMVDDAAPTSHS